MANEVRIEDLAQLAAIKDNDLVIIVDSAEMATEETAKKATVSQLKDYLTPEFAIIKANSEQEAISESAGNPNQIWWW